MILVDSSVWIDYFRGRQTREAAQLDALLGVEPVAIGDLMLAEVLQGFVDDATFRRALALFEPVPVLAIGGRDIAVQAARNFRSLRARGVTVRKTIDTLIATRCIHDGLPMLFSDRDFDPFVSHLGLRAALP
jgi:predicted nucleic acid-binding protein